MKACSFFGHRDTPQTEELKDKVRETVERLIVEEGVDTFLFGSRSRFDELCHIVVTELKDTYASSGDYLVRLANASSVEILSGELSDITGMVSVATADAKVYLPIAEMVDIEAEKARVKAELEKAIKEVEFITAKLSNENFTSKAPKKVIDEFIEKEKKAKDLVKKLEENYNAL